ncbi:methyltransferase domain-containing protein [Halobacteriaceae archaeon GCM10025711]
MANVTPQETETEGDERPDRVNLGCGDDYRDGWLNVDVDDRHDVDVVHDLEETPWRWGDSQFGHVLMDNVLEHIAVEHRTAVLEECHRILEPGGTLTLRLPVPEVGAGWDETHHAVPHWRVLCHPRWRDRWAVDRIAGSKVGPGRLFPEPLARLATRFWVFRGMDEVTVTARALPE